MTKQTRKRLAALLLSIAMVFSMVADALPAALAAGEGAAAPATNNFSDSASTRRPGLYVDFLGDNNRYLAPGETAALGSLKAPAGEDWSAVTNPKPGGETTWTGYKPEEVTADGSTIFWVGVGIDRMNVLDLFRQNDSGIYSLELGFYYDSQFIEPYTGNGDYKAVIEAANINNPNYPNQWSHLYEIVAAETDLRPQVEPVTQERMDGDQFKPDLAELTDPDAGNTWRMTYVSLEKTGTGASRFSGIYEPDKKAEEDEGTRYLLLIPFRLKQYDPNYTQRLCLRLVRNASLFSIGGGDDGASPYAAWEKVTVRNKDRELKLMTNFMGDLNIFDGGKRVEKPYQADLVIHNYGGIGNEAILSVTNDPSYTPVTASSGGNRTIYGLYGGTGMTLDVTVQSGYTVQVVVCNRGAWNNGAPDPGDVISRTEVWDNDKESHYTFVMPDGDVEVHVTFSLTPTTEFWLYLSEDHDGEKPLDSANKIEPNYTKLTATYDVDPPIEIDRDNYDATYDGMPGKKVLATSRIQIDVDLHEDYNAVVRVFNVATDSNMQVSGTLPPGASMDADSVVTMTKSGQLVVASMPQSDVVVYVTYEKATQYRATLMVDHEPDTKIMATNVAQLETTLYTDGNDPVTAYSGVVYHDDNGTPDNRDDDTHDAVAGSYYPNHYPLPKVDASAAELSGSLGGDGPRSWNGDAGSILAQLYSAFSGAANSTGFAAGLSGNLSAYDLQNVAVSGKAAGLRKDSVGAGFVRTDLTYDSTTGGTIPEIYNVLYSMLSRAAGTGPDAITPTEVREDPADLTSRVLYTYYDLTPEQVQMYLLDYAAAQAAGSDVTQVAIRDGASAATALNGYTWDGPSLTSVPPTASSDPFVQVRSGRQVAVLLEADSAYTVLNSIVIKDVETDPLLRHPDVVLQVPQDLDIQNGDYKDRDPDYKNVYLFDMPAYDCEVWVTYGLRETRELRLSIEGDNNDPGNTASMVAYTPRTNPRGTAAQAVTINKNGDKIENVLVGSTATVTVHVAPGYEVTAEIVYYRDGVERQVTTLSATSPIRDPGTQALLPLPDGTVFTFQMPDCGETEYAEVRIKYEQTDKKVNNAHIRGRDYPGSTSDPGNRAVWTSNGSPDMVATEDDLLEGTITVAPGSYIHSVTTYTKDGEAGPYLGAGYPFFLEGNGWNNGNGGTVKLTTTMPDKEYWVEVTFRNGPPTPEPEQALSLLVRDEDNTGADDNWATATVSRTAPGANLVLGPVGKAHGSMYAAGYAIAGETVKLDFKAQVDSGYYVESIEVLPAALAVPVSWTSTTTAEFVMPAGSAAVEVTFRKTNPDVPRTPLFLQLAKTERGGASPENTVVSFTSPTIPGGYSVGNLPQEVPVRGSDSRGAARAGETVSLDIKVAPGWHIHSLTVTGEDGRLSYELPYDLTDNGYNGGAGGNVTAKFVMPNSDARVVVNYRIGEPPAVKTEFEMELMVVDPDNVLDPDDPAAVYADNWASAVISGQTGVVGPVGRRQSAMRQVAYTRSGGVVTVDYQADTGYALDIIIVTPTGLKIPVTYLEGGRQAQFTMPAEDVTVLVRFKAGEPNRYMANLVLHMPDQPDGTPMPLNRYDLVGEGTFNITVGGVQYNLDLGQKIYSVMATPGQRLDVDLWAKDGYYIRAVEVAPEALGVGATLSGAFGRQDSSLVMPAANIQVNVYFERGWPDDVKEYDDTVNYDLTLEVYDSTAAQSSTANFVSIDGKVLTTPNNDKVKGGESLTVTPRQSYDDDLVVVALDPAPGCYAESITVRDSRGKRVPWRYVPGGIGFEMPPAHVTVTVKYAQLTGEIEKDREHTLRLHVVGNSGGDSASVSRGGSVILDQGNMTLSRQVTVGETLTLSASPDQGIGHTISAAYAIAASGTQLIVPMALVADGGTVDFAMPDEDADVWVYFTGDPAQQPDPSGDDLMGTLIVAGPAGAGSAELYARVDGTKDSTTGIVNAAGGGTMFAPRDTELVVDLTVNTGYYVNAIRVVDGRGNPVSYTWTQGKGQREFTLAMPVTGVQVYVELRKLGAPDDPDDPVDTTQLTAQVVVNNGGGAGNKATLRRNDGTGAFQSDKVYLKPVSAGEQIYLDIEVQPGYQIEYVKMVPVKGGVAPTLYQPPIQTQSSYFVMPGEDVVIYVRFVRDDRDRWDATLFAEGDNTTGNQAWIRSVYSGQKGPVSPVAPPNNSTSVRAAAATATQPAEWVYVDYEWADGCSIKSVTVVDADGNPVPFTQDLNDNTTRRGKIRFPMVDSTVTVTVTYQKDPEPLPKYPVILHVADLGPDGVVDRGNWSRVSWDTDQRQVHANGDNEADPLMVPAGETVDVDVHAEPNVYIQAAYVLYRDGGQMLYFNLEPDDPGPGFTGDKEDNYFVMHPDRVDVYVYYTRTKPLSNDYAAVLMLDSPSEDTTSFATITNQDADTTYQVGTATVVANTPADGHGYVTATDGDRIEVQVTPAPGYAIESILMTPLGTSSDQGGPVVTTRRGNLYTFTMPAHNVAVRVKLRKSSTKEYKAWLHYRMAEWDPVKEEYKPTDPRTDWASLSYTGTDGVLVTWDVDNTFELVNEGAIVTLGVSLDDPRWVLAAYVLREDGYMEPLSKALEKLQEGNSDPDDTLLDDEATFTMPAADVHAFVWFTETPPSVVDQWRTAVLTVTDDDGAGLVNSGLNSADIWSSVNNTAQTEVFSVGVLSAQKVDEVTGLRTGPMIPGHHFMWVQEGETVSVQVNPPHNGYVFQNPATISHSDGSATLTLTEDASNRPKYVYTYDVGPFNSAVRVHFRSSTLVQNPLKVVLIDKDNPGNGTVTNVVRVTPGSMTPLSVQSTTSAGARQRVPDVLEGTAISFTVTPDQVPGGAAGERYMAVARWIDDDTNVSTSLPLTRQPDGSYVGTSFAMPSSSATLEVTFYKAWNVTLSVKHIGNVPTADQDSVAQLTESAFGSTITAVEGTPGTAIVPNATDLAASMQTLNPNVRVVSVLLKRSGRMDTPLSPDGGGVYHHTLSRSDVEIQFILAPKTEVYPTYIASVSAVNKPAAVADPDAVADPEIHVPAATRSEAPGWTAAKENDAVEVTLDVPYGYKAELTATNGASLSKATVDATDVTAGITGEKVTFTMPAANVHVTVKYIKTRFTATIRIAGNGSGTAVWDAYPTTAVIADLKGGETLPFTATPAGGSRISSIIGSGSIGYISGSTTSTVKDSITMPKEDVVITVVFTKERAKTHYLDLHVSGTAYGTATLAAEKDGTPVGTLTSMPTSPKGFSRIDSVETGSTVTLNVKPNTDYQVTVGYYLHDGLALTYTTYNITSTDGGDATFLMPDTNVCIYVTFRGPGEDPDPDPNARNLDLHVSGTNGGTASLTTAETAGSRSVSSSPTAPASVSTIPGVEQNAPVTLTVKPEDGFMVTVSYYVYSGGTLTFVSQDIDTNSGGTAEFTMPAFSTCVYVTFRAKGDSLHYLDLHVTNPAGGTATLSTDGFGTLRSTPANPQTYYGHIDQVETGTPVTLDISDVGADYTVTVSYYLHNGGTLYYNSFAIDSNSGGKATFDMPNTNTCIYVTFRGPGDDPDPDPDAHYLDLHVSGPEGGTATLTAASAADGTVLGSVSSTPTTSNTFQRIQPPPDGVPAGSPVTLEVKELQPDYMVTVSYYVYSGGTLTNYTSTIASADGGIATFDMPAYSTCVYVTFQKVEEPPVDPPDPPDPDEYIAFVTTEGTDGLPDNAAQDIVNRTNPALGGGVLWRYGETGDNMFVTFTTEPGYTAVVTATRVDNGDPVNVIQQGTTLVGTASLDMPGGTDVEVTITYTTVQPPKPHNLSLCLVGHDRVAANMGELTGGASGLRLTGADGPVSTTADAGAALALDAGWALKYRIRRITITSGGVTTDLNWNEYGQTATSLFFMPDADAVVTVYFNSAYKATLFVIDAKGDDFRNGTAADTTDPSATNVPNTRLEVTRLSTSLGYTTKTHTPIEDLYGDERVTTTVVRGTLPTDAEIASVIATTNSGTRNLTETGTNSGIYHYDMSTATRDPEDVDVTVILRDKNKDLFIATVYKEGHDNKPGNTAAITNTTTSGLPDGTIWTGAYKKDGLTVSVTTEPDYYAVVTAVIAGTNTPVSVLQWAVQGSFDATLTMPGANVDITVTYTKDPPKSDLKLTLSGHARKAGNIGTVSDVANAEPTLPLTANGGMAPDTNDFSVTRAGVSAGIQLQVWGQPDTGFMVEKMELKVAGMTIALTMDAQNKAYTPLPYGDVEIIIYYKEGNRTPRPFDPEHPHTVDNGDGTTKVVDDYEHGKIIGENNNNNTATVVVPVLYGTVGKDKNPDDKSTQKYNPYFEAESVTFKLYVRDDTTGVFTEIPSTDYTMTAPSGTGAYDNIPSPKKYLAADGVEYKYTSAKFILGEVAGGQLDGKIREGLTLYITATYDTTVADGPWQESLHTQLIIPPADQSPRPYDPVHSVRYNAPGIWSGGDYPTVGDDSPNPDWSDPTQEGWLLADNQDEKVTVLIPTLYFGSDAPAGPPAVDDDYVTDHTKALTHAGATTPVADGGTPELPPIYTFYWLEETDDGTGGVTQTYHPLVDGTDIDIDVSSMKSLAFDDNPKGDFPKAAAPDDQIHHYGYQLTFTPHVPADGSPASDGAKTLANYIENGGTIYVTATRRGGTDASAPTWVEQESEMTQVIIRNDAIPKPSDPDDLNSEDYEDRWITSENWVDYLIVTVPTLDTDGKHPISVDEEHVTFKFYLTQGSTADPNNAVDVTDLLVMINPNIFFREDEALDGGGVPYGKPHMVWDTRDISYPGEYIEAAKTWTPSGYAYEAEYESGNYYTGPDKDGKVTDFIGARFVLQLSKDADTVDSANADILRDIWSDTGGNYGTMNKDHPYRLYISAVNNSSGKDKESAKTDFEVPPYYTLSGILESYAPSHAATFRLYDTGTSIDPDRLGSHGYDVDDFKAGNVPFLVYQQLREWGFGSGLWQLEYSIRTSELMGNYDLLIEKAGHVSFTWRDMELSEATLDPADPRGLTFTVAGQQKDGSGNELVVKDDDGRILPGVIALYGGDINNDRYVRLEDYTVLSSFFGGQRAQNRSTDETSAKWKNSTYNPDSVAYLADLDGDLYVSPGDHAIWNTARNYNKNYTDYSNTWELRTGSVTPVTAEEMAFLMMEEPEELPPEEVPPEEEAPEEENPLPEEETPSEEDPSSESENPGEEPEPPVEEPSVPNEGESTAGDGASDEIDQPTGGEDPPLIPGDSENETGNDLGSEPDETQSDKGEVAELPPDSDEDETSVKESEAEEEKEAVNESHNYLETGQKEPLDSNGYS